MAAGGHQESDLERFRALAAKWPKSMEISIDVLDGMRFSGKSRWMYWTECNRDDFSLVFTVVNFKSGDSTAE